MNNPDARAAFLARLEYDLLLDSPRVDISFKMPPAPLLPPVPRTDA